jgi:broad specificity phosphatase PhoE
MPETLNRQTTAQVVPARTVVDTLWLVRHAEVEQKYQRVFGGRIDMGLSPRGELQAARLSEYLKIHSFDAVYASPMRRVQQTLRPMLQNGFPRPIIISEFREVDFGEWTGHTWDEVEEKFGVSAFTWLDQLECDGIPKAECADKLRARVAPALEAVLRNHPGGKVAIICHGGVIRMILSILLRLPFACMDMFEIEYASTTQVRFQMNKPQLQLLSFSPWRDVP